MKIKLIIPLLTLTFFLTAQVPENILRYRTDQKGNSNDRKKSYMDGNKVRTIFSNGGEISNWASFPESNITMEWPKGSGHYHLKGFTLLLAAKLKIQNTSGQDVFITSVGTQYKEEMDRDPGTGEQWGFEPKGNYSNPDSSLVAISSNQYSWPSQWPVSLGIDDSWDGNWFGYYGKGRQDSVIETFYVMDDSKDKEYTREPYKHFPIKEDTVTGGLGLRVEVRGMQFQQKALEDILFWDYHITNISDFAYDSASIGFFCVPINNAGGTIPDLNMKYFYGDAEYGYFGITVLNSETNEHIANVSSEYVSEMSDKGLGAWPKNDVIMWGAMTGGFVSSVMANSNLEFVVGGSVFQFEKWSTKNYAIAMVFGNDLTSIIQKRNIAQKLYRNNYIVTEEITNVKTAERIDRNNPLTFLISQNYPNPFNPSTMIRFDVPVESDIDVSIFDILGRKLESIVSGHYARGSYIAQWNGSKYSSGIYFYALRSGAFSQTKKMILQK